MTDIDPKKLKPGTVVRHRLGGTVILSHRKADESGWWNTDASGLDDSVWASEDWGIAPVQVAVNVLLHHAIGATPCETACTHQVSGAWTALGVSNVIGRAAEREASS